MKHNEDGYYARAPLSFWVTLVCIGLLWALIDGVYHVIRALV